MTWIEIELHTSRPSDPLPSKNAPFCSSDGLKPHNPDFHIKHITENIINSADKCRRGTDNDRFLLPSLRRALTEPLQLPRQHFAAFLGSGGYLHRQDMGNRRIGKQLPVKDFLFIKAFIILRRRMQNAVMLRLIGLYATTSPGLVPCLPFPPPGSAAERSAPPRGNHSRKATYPPPEFP